MEWKMQARHTPKFVVTGTATKAQMKASEQALLPRSFLWILPSRAPQRGGCPTGVTRHPSLRPVGRCFNINLGALAKKLPAIFYFTA